MADGLANNGARLQEQGRAPPAELTSILTQVQSLQTDREKLLRELEETRARMDKLQVPPRAAARFFPNFIPPVLGITRIGDRPFPGLTPAALAGRLAKDPTLTEPLLRRRANARK